MTDLIINKEYCPENVIFKPEWEYSNPHTSFVIKVGVIPGKFTIFSFGGKAKNTDDIRKGMDLVDKVFGESDMYGKEYLAIVEYSKLKEMSVNVKKNYAIEINRINRKYKCIPKYTLVSGADLYLRTSHKLVARFINQRFFYTDTIEEAYEKIESLSHLETAKKEEPLQNSLKFEDVVFKPEWQYYNPQTNFRYTIGIIESQFLYVSTHGKSNNIEDLKRATLLLDLAFDEGNLQGTQYFNITDFSDVHDTTSLSQKRYYANEIKRINQKYNCSPKLSILCGLSFGMKMSVKLFSNFVNQRFVFVDNIEQAFEKVNSFENKNLDSLLKITVSQEHIDEIVNLSGSIIWENDLEIINFDNIISPNNPLKEIEEAFAVVREDVSYMVSNYKNILEIINTGVLISDTIDRKVLYVNQAAMSMLEISKDDINGVQCNNFLCKKRDCECTLSDVCQSISSDELVIYSKNGEQKYLTLSMIIDIFENKTCYIHTFNDITDIKKSHIEKEKHLADLSRSKKQLLSMMEDLEESKHIAETASKAKSEFLANMSHEIRTPLNGVIGFTDLLLKTNLSETQKSYMQNVETSANNLMDLIDDILDLSKIDAGKMELDVKKSDIKQIIEQACDVVKFKIQSKQIELLLNLNEAIPQFAKVDDIRLRQVLINLLGNASKFTEKGEIEIGIQLLNNDVENKLVTIRYYVRDTGIGISEFNQQKLFQSFTQADASTTRKYGGTGLGLSISSKLLSLMNSKLKIESTVGIGSKFYFDLTLAYYDEAQTSTYIPQKIKNVLVIDDNLSNISIIESMLKQLNITCQTANDGIEGLSKLLQNSFDLVIVDYLMPFMNGIEVIEKIRAAEALMPNKQNIVFLHSATEEISISEKCKQLNVPNHIIKPLKFSNLITILQRVENPILENNLLQKIASELSESINLAKFKIIIAEDNELNMVLAKTFVKSFLPNSIIIEAVDGQKAVDLYLEHKPDLVLMDVHMPNKDGHQATTEIRIIEQQTNSHVPIIALTAGNIKGEREMCYGAGMDDFITKPVIEDTIHDVISKWLFNNTDTKVRNHSNLTLIKNKINNNKTIEDESLLHFNKAEFMKSTGNNENLFKMVSNLFVKDMPIRIENLSDAINQDNIDEIKLIAHTIKGLALNMHCSIMAKLSEKLELLARNDYNKDTAYKLLIEIKNEYPKIVFEN
jgi:signal transduction histidine kinase/CheY-like chemotaxis protein/PAS domain-containing protein/HPt (histidine-containing phosphotransfer) domain-containing protein